MLKVSNMKYFTITGSTALLLLIFSSPARSFDFTDVLQAGSAYLTHVVAHETGHNVVGHMAGGRNVKMDFFKNKNGDFFVGTSSVGKINTEEVLPFRAAGIAASNHTFDMALASYRVVPTTYNKALLFFSGTDFLWYSLWSFYIKGSDDPSYDPVGISQETGLSSETILGMALLQTALNAFRAYSGDDTTVPYLFLNEERMNVGVRVSF